MTAKKMDVNAYIQRENELSEIVVVDKTHIVINIPGDMIDGEYEISLDTCKTADQVLSWVFQLTEKSWMTRDILRRFIKEASHHAGVTL